MIIEARDLSVSFGSLKVVDQLSLQCAPGKVTALVGPNGAGKTTLFKMLLGLLTPDKGTVVMPGKGRGRVRGFVEKPSLYPYLSGLENLNVIARYQKLAMDKEQLGQKLVAVGLDPDRSDPVRHYSMGMKQRLGIAAALLSEPAALILDEPFSGLDPTGIRDLSALLKRLAAEHRMAILVSSHFVDQLVRFCDHIYVMSSGRVIDHGAATELMARHTRGYFLEGPDLGESAVLKGLGVQVEGERTFVHKNDFAQGRLLQRLAAEGTLVLGCTAQLDLDHLFRDHA